MRFPTRTLVLMVLTLLAFGWMYWRTHLSGAKPAPVDGGPVPVELVAPAGGGTP